MKSDPSLLTYPRAQVPCLLFFQIAQTIQPLLYLFFIHFFILPHSSKCWLTQDSLITLRTKYGTRRYAGSGEVVALCDSLHKGSDNRGLIQAATKLSKGAIEGVEIVEVDIAALPMLNTDLEEDGRFPVEVEVFRQNIMEADSVLFASPEYNYYVSAPMKNALDWASRPPNVWGGKATAIVSAGGMLGGGRGQSHLRDIGVFLDLHFLNKPEFLL